MLITDIMFNSAYTVLNWTECLSVISMDMLHTLPLTVQSPSIVWPTAAATSLTPEPAFYTSRQKHTSCAQESPYAPSAFRRGTLNIPHWSFEWGHGHSGLAPRLPSVGHPEEVNYKTHNNYYNTNNTFTCKTLSVFHFKRSDCVDSSKCKTR